MHYEFTRLAKPADLAGTHCVKAFFNTFSAFLALFKKIVLNSCSC